MIIKDNQLHHIRRACVKGQERELVEEILELKKYLTNKKLKN